MHVCGYKGTVRAFARLVPGDGHIGEILVRAMESPRLIVVTPGGT